MNTYKVQTADERSKNIETFVWMRAVFTIDGTLIRHPRPFTVRVQNGLSSAKRNLPSVQTTDPILGAPLPERNS